MVSELETYYKLYADGLSVTPSLMAIGMFFIVLDNLHSEIVHGIEEKGEAVINSGSQRPKPNSVNAQYMQFRDNLVAKAQGYHQELKKLLKKRFGNPNLKMTYEYGLVLMSFGKMLEGFYPNFAPKNANVPNTSNDELTHKLSIISTILKDIEIGISNGPPAKQFNKEVTQRESLEIQLNILVQSEINMIGSMLNLIINNSNEGDIRQWSIDGVSAMLASIELMNETVREVELSILRLKNNSGQVRTNKLRSIHVELQKLNHEFGSILTRKYNTDMHLIQSVQHFNENFEMFLKSNQLPPLPFNNSANQTKNDQQITSEQEGTTPSPRAQNDQNTHNSPHEFHDTQSEFQTQQTNTTPHTQAQNARNGKYNVLKALLLSERNMLQHMYISLADIYQNRSNTTNMVYMMQETLGQYEDVNKVLIDEWTKHTNAINVSSTDVLEFQAWHTKLQSVRLQFIEEIHKILGNMTSNVGQKGGATHKVEDMLAALKKTLDDIKKEWNASDGKKLFTVNADYRHKSQYIEMVDKLVKNNQNNVINVDQNRTMGQVLKTKSALEVFFYRHPIITLQSIGGNRVVDVSKTLMYMLPDVTSRSNTNVNKVENDLKKLIELLSAHENDALQMPYIVDTSPYKTDSEILRVQTYGDLAKLILTYPHFITKIMPLVASVHFDIEELKRLRLFTSYYVHQAQSKNNVESLTGKLQFDDTMSSKTTLETAWAQMEKLFVKKTKGLLKNLFPKTETIKYKNATSIENLKHSLRKYTDVSVVFQYDDSKNNNNNNNNKNNKLYNTTNNTNTNNNNNNNNISNSNKYIPYTAANFIDSGFELVTFFGKYWHNISNDHTVKATMLRYMLCFKEVLDNGSWNAMEKKMSKNNQTGGSKRKPAPKTIKPSRRSSRPPSASSI